MELFKGTLTQVLNDFFLNSILIFYFSKKMIIFSEGCVFAAFQAHLLLTVIFALTSSTGHAGLGGDRHQGLSDGLLPALSHLHAHSWGGQRGAVVRTGIVLPNIVNHGGCDDLKAVRVAALGQVAVVSGEFHLEDLRQRDFLQGRQRLRIRTRKKQNQKEIDFVFLKKMRRRIFLQETAT